MNRIKLCIALAVILALFPGPTFAADKPNIVVIMGDDIGWFNIGAYHQGMMAGRTPNLDKLAAEGMRFTDYYAEASCTAAAPPSSPASCRSAPAWLRSVRQVHPSDCPPRR